MKRYGLICLPGEYSHLPDAYTSEYVASKDAVFELYPTQPENINSRLDEITQTGIYGIRVTDIFRRILRGLYPVDDISGNFIFSTDTITLQGSYSKTGRNFEIDGIVNGLFAHIHYDKSKPINSLFKGQRAIVLGAGIKANNVIHALIYCGCREILIVNRTLDHAEKLVKDFSRHERSLRIDAITLPLEQNTKWLWEWPRIIINTLPSMIEFPFDFKIFDQSFTKCFVADINTSETFFSKKAHEANICCWDGRNIEEIEVKNAIDMWSIFHDKDEWDDLKNACKNIKEK